MDNTTATFIDKPFVQEDLDQAIKLLDKRFNGDNRVIAITMNSTEYQKLKERVEPNIMEPKAIFEGKLHEIYSGIDVFMVVSQIEPIKYWRDRESLNLYLKTKENENNDL